MNQRRVIILNCFGRGGSNIVWNMIGSSPDVIMTEREWHQAVFGTAHRFRKLATRSAWKLGASSVRLLRRRAYHSLLAMRSPGDLLTKQGAASIVTKVMDYHMAFNPIIAGGFDEVDYVTLARHPFSQCESLMRSGLSLRDACRWYADIAGLMAENVTEHDGIVVRFEDLVEKPIDCCDRLYARLKIAWRSDASFRLKKKQFGENRRGDGDYSENRFEWIAVGNASQHIDAMVVKAAIGRLSPGVREEIWRRTEASARKLGYRAGTFADSDPSYFTTGLLELEAR